MLIEFSVKNFRSFQETATLSLAASSVKERQEDNTFVISDKLSLLKNAVILGKNAGGKSNLFQAMQFMDWFIVNSSKETQASTPIPLDRFRLHDKSLDAPASFEIVFVHEGVQYRYGFAVTEKAVQEEWLYYVPNVKELEVFTRHGQTFELSRHFKSEELLVSGERIRPNALFVSVSAQFNGKIASAVLNWFARFNCISSLDSGRYAPVTLSLSEKESGRGLIREFLKRADMGIEDFHVVETAVDSSALPQEVLSGLPDNKKISRITISTAHKKYNGTGDVVGMVEFDMGKDESHGTQKFFELSGPIIDTLANGKVLFVDELDARLHPNLVRAICELFNSREFNPRNAQLVFATHNTNILSRKELLRRDQIWFVEKNARGASELFSLVEFRDPKNDKMVRNDASYEKSYLNGIYGAVPLIRDLGVKYGDG